MKRVNTFVDMNTELVKSNWTRTKRSSKRAGDELKSDNLKKQKLDKHVKAEEKDDQEEAEMKRHIEIVKDDEVAINAIPLATKPPVIVEYKIDKYGRMGYFKLIRADGSSKVILFGTIPTTISDTTPSVISPTTHIDTTLIPTVSPTIPPLPDYIPASPDYPPVSDTEFDPSEDPSSDHIPPLPATSSFISSTDDTSDNDIPDTPPSPTYDTPFTETALSTQSSPVASGALRQTSPDSSADASSDPASSRSSFDHSLPTPSSGMRPSHHLCSLVPSIHRLSAANFDRPSHDSSFASPSRKRSRSPTASVLLSLPIPGALYSACADLLPSPKRIRSPETTTDLEDCLEYSFEPYVPREAGLGVDFEDKSSELSRYRGNDLEMDVDVVRSDGIDIDPEIQAEIDECIAYADALRDRGINARIVVKAIDREEIETGMRGPVEVRVDRVTHPVIDNDIPKPAQEGVVEVTYETLGDLVQRIVVIGQQSVDMLERIGELEQNNMRLRDMMNVASQRVSRSERRELRVQRKMRQIRHFRFMIV
ncbi:hypothetical protein Tco_1456565 [Tanacetum coccineum]